jgi:hypothetical protein
MGHFHLMHCVPHPVLHGLNGYKEVIDAVAWGLGQLGHRVTYALNGYEPGATNVIFGAQVIPVDVLKRLPLDSIVYNFEQMRHSPSEVRRETQFIAGRFRVWDYSPANIESWRAMGSTQAQVVRIGYAPVLTRIAKPAIQDIDVLMYGLTGEGRLQALHQLSNRGLKTVFVSGLYGQERDDLIARSKLVVNVHLYDTHRIFELVRASYLFANRKAVVAVVAPDSVIDDEFRSAARFTTGDRLIEDCVNLLERVEDRARLETEGFNAFARHDIRPILSAALDGHEVRVASDAATSRHSRQASAGKG